jgi:glutathione S-transferase
MTDADTHALTLACARGYLDFRFAALDWRARAPKAAAWHARINARASMQATMPAG